MYYNKLTKMYPVSKTIRNELIPIGKTLENIHKNSILESDQQRKEDYKRVKLVMDNYHKRLMSEALEKVELSTLNEAADIYLKNDKKTEDMEEFSKCQEKMRKEIVNNLKAHENYGIINKKEILDVLEKQSDINEEDYNAIESFRNFFTYFTSYNKVRENLYSDEEKSSTVAYRLINENLPKFLDNIRTYEKVKNNNVKADDMTEEEQDSLFIVSSFNLVLCQHGIDEYNASIGKINSAINLYNQKNSKEKDFRRIPKMKELYKQILSDRESSFIEEIETDDELIKLVDDYGKRLTDYLETDKIKSFFNALKNSGGYKVYLKNDVSKTSFSNIVFGEWNKIDELINNDYDETYSKKKTEKYYEVRSKALKKNKSYSIDWIIELSKDSEIIERYISEIESDIDSIKAGREDFSKVVLNEHEKKRSLAKNTSAVSSIKSYLDAIKKIERDVKLINGSGQELDKNLDVYGEQETLLSELRDVDVLYNMTRNYLTKKPFSTEKFKLNFNRSTLLNGWDKNKEKDNLGVLFIKDGKFYLGIMNTTANKSFVNPPKATTDKVYKKIEYKLLPGANKMLPKVFFAKSNLDTYNPSKELLTKYEKGTHIKSNKSFSIEDCHKLIDYFKDSINKHPDWSQFGFKFSNTDEYSDLSGFYREIEKQGYKISFTDIDEEYINGLIEKNELYLFQIYNKDFSDYSKGNLNLHTIYFTMLFDQRNLEDVVYKLNGEAEVFYRPASISAEEMIIHTAGDDVKNKNPKRAKTKPTSKFDYDIVKNRRYTKDKFALHVPITMNFGVDETKKFNDVVNDVIRSDEKVRVIGIDRGERNLLYVVVVDTDGAILEQISLNSIINKEYDIETDYHRLLNEKEGDRDKARKDWGTIENIKELKEGYLSQVVHVISDLVIKYNAIICLEDLNFGFKRGRQKVEKQVYQKFEKMLIDKFNYLVLDKSRTQEKANEPGGALNALQLTSKFESFKSLGKQTGIIYYVPAYLTSKIDPTTGFANLFYVKYESMEKAKEFFGRFNIIRFNHEGYFEFNFNYKSFTERACGVIDEWTVCTYGRRIVKFRNPEKNNSFDDKITYPTEDLKALLNKYGIGYESGENIKTSIINVNEPEFFRMLTSIFKETLQMRNSTVDSADYPEDYIISPVKNESGEFFISDPEDNKRPKDADANGAYNIAKKGLWVLDQIRNQKSGEKLNLAMSNAEWLEYAQKHKI